MIKKIITFFKYLLLFSDETKNFITLLTVEKQKTLFETERFIINSDQKRKKSLKKDQLAKELLLYEDYFIINKNDFKNFITKEG